MAEANGRFPPKADVNFIRDFTAAISMLLLADYGIDPR